MSKIYLLLNLKDYITLIGTCLGIIALICGSFGTRYIISLGFFLIAISIFTDLLDGYIARKTGTVNQLGKQLDSLSDSLTFGIVPAFLSYQAFKTGEVYDYILIIGAIIFVLGAIIRLARFNISEFKGYTGVPTPLSALLMICFYYANYFYAFAFGGGGLVGLAYPFPEISYYILPFYMIIIAWFNITTYISFKEKDKIVYVIFIIFAPIGPILGIIGILNPNFTISLIVCIIFIIGIIVEFIYIISGFFIRFKMRGKELKSE